MNITNPAMKKLLTFAIMATLVTGVCAQDIFSHKVGEATVTLLSEGQGQASASILVGATDTMLRQCAPDGKIPNAANAFLVRSPGRVLLIDTGYGRKLFDNLAAEGITPGQVKVILITHMHGDHIGGLLRDGKVAFPNAKLYIAQPEYDYWVTGKKNELAVKATAAYGDRLNLFQPTELNDPKPGQVLPGIRAIAAYGHTPGHTMFMIRSGGERILVWGDLTHAMAMQMPYPEVSVTYDTDPEIAASSREKTLQFATKNGVPVAGMHVAYPGMGSIKKGAAGGYAFTPFAE